MPKKTPTPEQLITAVVKREWDTVRQYISEGSDINGENSGGSTPLLNAVNGDDLAGVSILLKLGANPNLPEKGRVPLIGAVQHNNSAMIKVLLEYNADPNRRPFGSENSPLAEAAYHQKIDAAEVLLDYGADPNLQCSWFPLTAASAKPNYKTDMIELLIKYGAGQGEYAGPARQELRDTAVCEQISDENHHRTRSMLDERRWDKNSVIKKPTYGGKPPQPKETLKKRTANRQKALRNYLRRRP